MEYTTCESPRIHVQCKWVCQIVQVEPYAVANEPLSGNVPWDLFCYGFDAIVRRILVSPSSRDRKICSQPAGHHLAEPAPWWWPQISWIPSGFCLAVDSHWPPKFLLPADRRVDAASTDDCPSYYSIARTGSGMLDGFANTRTLKKLLDCSVALHWNWGTWMYRDLWWGRTLASVKQKWQTWRQSISCQSDCKWNIGS